MSLSCVKRGNKWVLTDPDGKKFGTHTSEASCHKQIAAIEANKHKDIKNLAFNGVVGKDFSLETLRDLTQSVNKGDKIRIVINSPGGSHIEALQILNELTSKEADITTVIESHAFSAGFTLALAGNKIEMHENALILIHPVAVQNVSGSAEELRTTALMAEKAQETLLVTLKARTSKGENELNQMIKNTTILTAKEALQEGLIDEVIPLRTRKVSLTNLEQFCVTLPEKIVAHVKSFDDSFKEGDTTMALVDVANKLQLDVTNVAEDETAIETLIVNAFGKQSEKIENLEKQIKELKEPKKSEGDGQGKKEVPSFVVNMAVKIRNQEIDSLLSGGFVTKATADQMKKDYADPDNLKNCLDAEGNETDKFENLVKTLKSNGKVLNLNGEIGSGVQQLQNPNRQLVDKDGKPIKEEDLLVNLMERANA